LRILVVDDLRTNAKLLEHMLKNKATVLTVLSGQEAIDICGSTEFDVILMDIMMPGMDGMETAIRIKENGFKGRVIFVTAYREFADPSMSDGIILKPVDQEVLMRKVFING